MALGLGKIVIGTRFNAKRNLALVALCIGIMQSAFGQAAQVTDLTVSRKPVWHNQQTGEGQSTALSFVDSTQLQAATNTHSAGRSKQKWMPEVLGAAVAVIDVNRDGAADIILGNSGRFGQKRPQNAQNRLLLNDGTGKFTDQTEAWNLIGSSYGMGIAVGDFNNDGWTDVVFTNYQGDNQLLKNTGSEFIDVSQQLQSKTSKSWSSSAGFADFNNDGYLDLYVARYVNYSAVLNTPQYKQGILIYSAPTFYDGVTDLLYINQAGERFIDHSAQAGVNKVKGKGLALAIGDIDRDGDQDIYVANDTSANQLWVNDGKAKFSDRAPHFGLAYSKIGREQASMGVDFSDINQDQRIDVAVSNFHGETTSIYLQSKANSFRESSDALGIGENARQRLSFGLDFFDADNDGDEDLIVANGHIDDNIWMNSDSISFAQYNSLYENLGSGKFLDVSGSAGPSLQAKQVSRGLVTADFDSDGLLDVIVANNDDQPQLLLNRAKPAGNFISLWFEGKQSNRSAIGARVIYQLGDKLVEREIMGAQSYLGVSDFRLHLGLGELSRLPSLEVVWPSGNRQTLKDIEANKFYHLLEQQTLSSYVPGKFDG